MSAERFWLIAIAASAGGIPATARILRALPRDLPAAVVVVQHRPSLGPSFLGEILGRHASVPVVEADDGDAIAQGVVYLARPDRHLTVAADRFRYKDGRRIRFVQSSANPLLESAAAAFGSRLIAVVLSGFGSNGTDGVQSVKAHGGVVIAQDRATSEHWGMPHAAVKSGAVDYVLPIDAIAPALAAIVEGRPIAGMQPT